MAPQCVTAGLLLAGLCLAALPSVPVAGLGYLSRCPTGKDLTAVQGWNQTLKSPRYPMRYPSDSNCSWLLTAPEGQVVVVYVLELDLEDSEFCQFDVLLLHDGGQPGHGPALARLCGEHCQPQYSSTGRQMYIQFLTDSSVRGKGFKLMFTAVPRSWMTTTRPTTRSTTTGYGGRPAPSCPRSGLLTVEFGRNQTLTSPNYPSNYSRYQDCGWTLRADAGRRVEVYVVDLDLENSTNCKFDNLTIYDGDNRWWGRLLAKLCGRADPALYVSSGRYMHIRFHSDDSVTRKGFKLFYTARTIITTTTPTTIPTTTRHARQSCPSWWPGAVLEAREGFNSTLTSPGYPLHYAPNLDCEWKIRAENASSTLYLYVLDLDIEKHVDCNYDKLTFIDKGDRPLVRRCGVITSTLLLNFSSQVTVMFHSDSSISGRGFKLLYTAVPADSRPPLPTTTEWNRNPNGVIFLTADLWDKPLSASFPQTNTKQMQNWVIKPRQIEGFIVRVFIVNLQLKRHVNGSCGNHLSIYDSALPLQDKLLEQLCDGIHFIHLSFFSGGPGLYLRLAGGEGGGPWGFRLLYSAVRHTYPQSLPGNLPFYTVHVQAESYYKDLKSLGYPRKYYSGERRQWIIGSQPGQTVQLLVQTMDLHDSSDCSNNIVRVTDSDDMAELAWMCSADYSGVSLFSVRGTTLHVRYSTGQTPEQGRGFHLRYRAVAASQARLGYTTQRPVTDPDEGSVRVAVIIAAVLGGCLALGVVLCVLCRACSRSKQYQRPHAGRFPSVTFRSRSRSSANASSAVYVVPSPSSRAPLDGFTNLAYSQGPPAYSSLQHLAPQAAASAHDVTGLPSYCEATRPQDKGGHGGLLAPPLIQSPTPQPTATEASPPSAPQPEEATPASSDSVNTSNS